jgi:hypothetical protein
MLTQAVLALVLVGQVSAAWAIPFLVMQGGIDVPGGSA